MHQQTAQQLNGPTFCCSTESMWFWI